VVCGDDRIRQIIPFRLTPVREAIRRALESEAAGKTISCWSDAGEACFPEWARCGDAAYADGAVLSLGYRVALRAEPARVWPAVAGIGGRHGWYAHHWLWRVRGGLDLLFGGPGLTRGRRDPDDVRVGDSLDFWRVLAAEPGRRLLLLAEMKTPGEAMLEIRLTPGGAERCNLDLISRFRPRGLAGLLYWKALWVPHVLVFRSMIRELARRSGSQILAGPSRLADWKDYVCSPPGGLAG